MFIKIKMISFKSIKNFVLVNSLMLVTSVFHFAFTAPTGYFTVDLLNQYIMSLTKNYLFIEFIEYKTKDKTKIMSEKRDILNNIPKERYYKEFDMFVMTTTLADSLSQLIIKKYFISDFVSMRYYDLIEFVFISFVFEIIFDFFHYWMHYYLHKTPILYQNFHKIHHKWAYPKPILTFYNHPLDFFITNSIPMFLTFLIFPFPITYFQYELLHTYKTLLEISGHSGKVLNSNSFTQCIWLPRFFNFQLKVEEHDLHHSLNNCNYGKRFSLWDKVFGTFVERNSF